MVMHQIAPTIDLSFDNKDLIKNNHNRPVVKRRLRLSRDTGIESIQKLSQVIQHKTKGAHLVKVMNLIHNEK